MAKLEKSQKEFLMLLLENENPQSIQSIQDQLDISRRTVYYIVNKINDVFMTYGWNRLIISVDRVII